MKTTVGVYDTHAKAIEAIKVLTNNGVPKDHLSILGKVDKTGNERLAEQDDDETKLMNVAGAEVGISTLAGTTLGILAGVGVLAIPGLGFLYGAGALAGAIAGFDIGLIGGGILTALTLPGLKNDIAREYESQIREGKFLVIAHGPADEVQKAHDIMHTHGTHHVLGTH